MNCFQPVIVLLIVISVSFAYGPPMSSSPITTTNTKTSTTPVSIMTTAINTSGTGNSTTITNTHMTTTTIGSTEADEIVDSTDDEAEEEMPEDDNPTETTTTLVPPIATAESSRRRSWITYLAIVVSLLLLIGFNVCIYMTIVRCCEDTSKAPAERKKPKKETIWSIITESPAASSPDISVINPEGDAAATPMSATSMSVDDNETKWEQKTLYWTAMLCCRLSGCNPRDDPTPPRSAHSDDDNRPQPPALPPPLVRLCQRHVNTPTVNIPDPPSPSSFE